MSVIEEVYYKCPKCGYSENEAGRGADDDYSKKCPICNAEMKASFITNDSDEY